MARSPRRLGGGLDASRLAEPAAPGPPRPPDGERRANGEGGVRMPSGSRTRGLVPGIRRRLPIEGPAPFPGAGRSPLNRAARLMLIGAVCALAVTMSLVTPGHQRDVAALGARYLVLAQSLTEGHYGLASSPLEEAEV